MAHHKGEQKPIVVDGTPLKDSVDFEMDGDTRTCTIVMSPALALEPIRVAMSFALLKQTTAQILIFEVGQEEARLDRLGQKYPIGLQHKRVSGEQILKEAVAEIEAAKKGKHPEPPKPDQKTPGFDL